MPWGAAAGARYTRVPQALPARGALAHRNPPPEPGPRLGSAASCKAGPWAAAREQRWEITRVRRGDSGPYSGLNQPDLGQVAQPCGVPIASWGPRAMPSPGFYHKPPTPPFTPLSFLTPSSAGAGALPSPSPPEPPAPRWPRTNGLKATSGGLGQDGACCVSGQLIPRGLPELPEPG